MFWVATEHPTVSPSRRRFLVTLFFVLAACGSGGGDGSGASDGGDPSADLPRLQLRWGSIPNVAGYVVHWGMRSGEYTHDVDVGSPPPDVEGVVTYVLDTIDVAGMYYFAITSYDIAGVSSAFSNEIAIAFP